MYNINFNFLLWPLRSSFFLIYLKQTSCLKKSHVDVEFKFTSRLKNNEKKTEIEWDVISHHCFLQVSSFPLRWRTAFFCCVGFFCHRWWEGIFLCTGYRARWHTFGNFLTVGLCIRKEELKKNEKQEAHGPWRSAREPTWPFAKFPHILPFQGFKLQLILALQAVVSEIQADFQNCHIWAWNLASGQSSRSCTYTLFLPQGVEIGLNFALRATVSKIQAVFQNFKSYRSCTYTLFLPKGRNWAYFCCTDSSLRDMGWFSKLQYLGMKLGNWPNFQKLHIISFYPRGP